MALSERTKLDDAPLRLEKHRMPAQTSGIETIVTIQMFLLTKSVKDNGWPFGDGEEDGLSKLRPQDFPYVQDGDPIIAPQFNVVKGGIVLTMSITHVIGDLVQFMDFLRSWSQNTSAIATARLNGQPVPPLPQQISSDLMDRSLLAPALVRRSFPTSTCSTLDARKMSRRKCQTSSQRHV
uniref:Trichothecene 3-O-acetyltransferase n=1 Tax=Fusarium oxysporum (strain Fo5176) TaxID=660025 RepID=A0A0C4DIV8_FUSOF